MSQQQLEALAKYFGESDSLGLPLASELTKLCSILPHDLEMAIVRGRRIVDLVLREIYSRHIGTVGTRPLENVISDLEKHSVLPRETAAHVRSLKEIANLCAHEGTADQDGLMVCLIDLVVVLRWVQRYAQTSTRSAPQFRAVDGLQLDESFREIDRILEVDVLAYGDLDPQSLGSAQRSRSWFQKNPQIYTLLFSGPQLVGYANVMPIEDEAFELAQKGQLHDGLIEADMIRTFELPGSYRLYVCSLAITPSARRHPAAFRTLYDGFFEKLFQLATAGVFVTEMVCNAWSADGRSLAKTFGMKPVAKHAVTGEVFQCTVVPPSLEKPVAKLKLLLDRYGTMGLS
jgi:hypothetical protein